MFVCQCAAVTDREVRTAIESGADSVEAVGHDTEAGTGCGGCHESIQALLADAKGKKPRPVLAVA